MHGTRLLSIAIRQGGCLVSVEEKPRIYSEALIRGVFAARRRIHEAQKNLRGNNPQ
jgi:hypothetical protein